MRIGCSDIIGVERRVDHDGGDGVRTTRDAVRNYGTPRRRPHGPRCKAGVARTHIVQPFIQEHVYRSAETAKQGHGRRVREVTLIVGFGHVAEIKVAGRVVAAITGGKRLVADAYDAKAGGQHETLLRAGHGNIDTPFFHPEIDGADRADAINKQQCRMVEVVEDLANAAMSLVTPVAVSL